jgi:hypothetical protein
MIIDNSTDDRIRGAALLNLAKYKTRLSDYKQRMADDADMVKQFEQGLGVEVTAYINRDPDPSEPSIEGLLEEVADKYADIVFAGERTMGEIAENELFALRNLAIGKTAPDIEGQDLDGVDFKLSDYRGKVVMLDFWGDW